MKKVLVLSLLAMIVSVYAKPCASGGVNVFCNWGDGKCWQIKSTDENGVEQGCATMAGYCTNMYSGGNEASNGSCSGKNPFTCNGCSWDDVASVYCDYGPLTPSGGGGCHEKPKAQGCGTGGTEVTKQQCDDRNNAGVSNNVVWCDFGEGNGCYEKTPEECAESGGAEVSSCDGSTPPPVPTLKFTANQNLIVSPFGRSLHISSAKGAMVSLYDMSGAKVYSGRVSAGNRVFSLERVPSGSYYAVVQAGSSSKKVSVVLK